MKKLLILILIALLLALSIFIVVNGLQIGSFELLGITGVKEKNVQLDEKIQEATKLASTDYEKIISTLNSNAKKLEEEKKNYDDMVSVSTDSQVQTATQIQKYEIETLWVKLGRHATSEGAVMKMEVTKGSNSASDTYNLKFTVNGSYISITDFISAIENDSMLGFKIEEFKMQPSTSGTDLEATFVCKDIAIKDVQETSTSQKDTNTNTDTNTTNNTNTTENNTNTTGNNTGDNSNTTGNNTSDNSNTTNATAK